MKPMNDKHLAILRRHMVELVEIQVELFSDELGQEALSEQVLAARLIEIEIRQACGITLPARQKRQAVQPPKLVTHALVPASGREERERGPKDVPANRHRGFVPKAKIRPRTDHDLPGEFPPARISATTTR